MRARGAVSPATCLELDSQPVQLPSWREAAEQVVFHEEARVAYRISGDRRRITVVTAPKNAALRTVLMKLVRELAMSAAWSPRGLILHAAACVVDGRAVLIAGPRRAGKTSLLLHALRAEGVRLLSNDRVVLELDADATVVHGMPTIVSLRTDTVVRQFPSPSAFASALRYRFALTVQAEGPAPATDLTPRGWPPAGTARPALRQRARRPRHRDRSGPPARRSRRAGHRAVAARRRRGGDAPRRRALRRARRAAGLGLLRAARTRPRPERGRGARPVARRRRTPACVRVPARARRLRDRSGHSPPGAAARQLRPTDFTDRGRDPTARL
jgi:hypothetical protein